MPGLAVEPWSLAGSDPRPGGFEIGREIGEPSDPFSQFVVYDETDGDYQQDPVVEERSAAPRDLPAAVTKVAVPRRVLYLQGALLAIVALFSLSVGMLIGARRGGDQTDATVHGPQPCLLTGRIALQTQDESLLPDQGAVAIVLPQQSRPEEQWEIVGLRPQDPPLPDVHTTVRAIRALGGDLARADADGRYRLQVAQRGNYFVLVISATRRSNASELPRPIQAQIGRYFRFTSNPFNGYDYRWQEESVRADRQLNFTF